MSSENDLLLQLKKRMEVLNQRLEDLILKSETDLEIARLLQKKLIQNQVSTLPGLKCVARYFQNQDIGSESYHVLPSIDQKYVWFVLTQTESFGLSSVLLQALTQLHTHSLLQKNQGSPDLESFFNELIAPLKDLKRVSKFRLLVAQFNTHTLKIRSQSIGYPPALWREKSVGSFSPFHVATLQPDFSIEAVSSDQIAQLKASTWEETLRPGSRIYFMNTLWNPKGGRDFYSGLDLKHFIEARADLVDDANELLLRADKFMKKNLEPSQYSDLTLIALEIDERKLHLA